VTQTGLPASERYKAGAATLRDTLRRAVRDALKPPPRLTLSQWAAEYAYLSPETSAEAGKFRAFAYQNGIMDAVTDPLVRQITVMKSARVGYTKILDHIVGYFIHQDPSPVLVVQPRVEDAEDYSRTEIAPMLRDTPVLAEIAGDLKAKDSNQRILKRVFRNGSSISFVGANSPGGFRRITTRVVCFDEVDGYPKEGAGEEGDQIALGVKRTESFWNRKVIVGSTPTVKDYSRIEKSFRESDQRRYYVPCPQCGHRQVLKWQNLHWDKAENGAHLPETAHFVCEVNGCIIDESHKPAMVEQGEWIAEAPFGGHAGFHIWAAYSLFPNAAWRYLVEEWLRVHKDPSLRRTFVNLVLGETWEEDAERVDSQSIMGRAEDWGDKAPTPVLLVTCGVDVQDDRLEIERVGWGAEEESWSLDHRILYGDPSSPDLWRELEDYLLTRTTRADGVELPVHAACIDSGGHHTAAVYRFVKDRFRRRVFAIKGMGGPGRPVWPKRASKNNKGKVNLFLVGVDAAKDAIYARLKMTEPGPGYCHFPKRDFGAKPEGTPRDPAYFEQLTAEIVQTKFVKGFPHRVYVLPSGKRNEALDLRVYAYAALISLNVRWGQLLAAQAASSPPPPRRDEDTSEPAPAPAPHQAGVAIPAHRQVRRDGWLSRPRGGWLR
jgi:phage terminase large subunit GpA-like protein